MELRGQPELGKQKKRNRTSTISYFLKGVYYFLCLRV